MKGVTIIITAFMRPDCLQRCVESIRRFYPKIKIIVSDNGRPDPYVKRLLVETHKCRYLELSFDSGASLAKNVALNLTKSKYAVIIDDDFEFTKETKLEKFKTILDNDETIGVVGGEPLTSSGRTGTKGSRLLINTEKSIFWRFPIEDPEWREIDGIKYHIADYTRQFLMIRNLPDIRWDDDLKIGGLHAAFFLNLKLHTKWRVAYVPEVRVIHSRAHPNIRYTFYRRRKDFKIKFYEKMGLRYGVFHNHTIIDFKSGKKVKPPDFEKFNAFRPEA